MAVAWLTSRFPTSSSSSASTLTDLHALSVHGQGLLYAPSVCRAGLLCTLIVKRVTRWLPNSFSSSARMLIDLSTLSVPYTKRGYCKHCLYTAQTVGYCIHCLYTKEEERVISTKPLYLRHWIFSYDLPVLEVSWSVVWMRGSAWAVMSNCFSNEDSSTLGGANAAYLSTWKTMHRNQIT